MSLDLIYFQILELKKILIEPILFYKTNEINISDFEKRILNENYILISELVRISAYQFVNDFENTNSNLELISSLISKLDSKEFSKNNLISEIENYIKNFPDGKKNLILEKIDTPYILKLIQFYDEKNFTNQLYIVSNYLFQILNLIYKSDGGISDYEKKFLDAYGKSLHQFHETQIENKSDYINLNSVFNDFFGSVSEKKPTESKEEKKSEGNVSETKQETYNLDDLLKELNELVGLNSVKDEIKNLINILKVEKLRKEKNLPVPQRSLHTVFTGNPGTGKTTIARLIAKIFQALGILEKGHLIETDRSGLVAGYVGQTSNKTLEICKKALGGVLFIDEAYSLSEGGENDFGKEAINTLLKYMEDNRANFIIIVAGYTGNMKEFIHKNPGLESRFNKYIEFPDYTPNEMEKIFLNLISKSKLKITAQGIEKVLEVLITNYENRNEKFGNGRFVRNLFEKFIQHKQIELCR